MLNLWIRGSRGGATQNCHPQQGEHKAMGNLGLRSDQQFFNDGSTCQVDRQQRATDHSHAPRRKQGQIHPTMHARPPSTPNQSTNRIRPPRPCLTLPSLRRRTVRRGVRNHFHQDKRHHQVPREDNHDRSKVQQNRTVDGIPPA